MSYAVENALFQWEDGEQRLRETEEPARSQLDRGVMVVLDELRRRLGSAFSVEELADLYSRDLDWASDLAQSAGAGTDASWVVDAAFHHYAREAANYAGGRTRFNAGRANVPGNS